MNYKTIGAERVECKASVFPRQWTAAVYSWATGNSTETLSGASVPELIKTDERWLLQTMNPLTFLKHGHVFVMMRPQDGRWLDGQHWNAKRGETKKKTLLQCHHQLWLWLWEVAHFFQQMADWERHGAGGGRRGTGQGDENEAAKIRRAARDWEEEEEEIETLDKRIKERKQTRGRKRCCRLHLPGLFSSDQVYVCVSAHR